MKTAGQPIEHRNNDIFTIQLPTTLFSAVSGMSIWTKDDVYCQNLIMGAEIVLSALGWKGHQIIMLIILSAHQLFFYIIFWHFENSWKNRNIIGYLSLGCSVLWKYHYFDDLIGCPAVFIAINIIVFCSHVNLSFDLLDY